MSQIRKTGLTFQAEGSAAALRTIESNLRAACIPLQVSFTNDGLTSLKFIPFIALPNRSSEARTRPRR
jgi:hypothetical protein